MARCSINWVGMAGGVEENSDSNASATVSDVMPCSVASASSRSVGHSRAARPEKLIMPSPQSNGLLLRAFV